AVDDLPAALILVEPEMPVVVQHPSGLRRDLSVDAGDVAGEWIGGPEVIRRRVLEPGVPVANGRESKTGHGRVLGDVRKLVNVIGDGCSCPERTDRRS